MKISVIIFVIIFIKICIRICIVAGTLICILS